MTVIVDVPDTAAAIPLPLERTVAGRYTRATPAAVLLSPGAR